MLFHLPQLLLSLPLSHSPISVGCPLAFLFEIKVSCSPGLPQPLVGEDEDEDGIELLTFHLLLQSPGMTGTTMPFYVGLGIQETLSKASHIPRSFLDIWILTSHSIPLWGRGVKETGSEKEGLTQGHMASDW